MIMIVMLCEQLHYISRVDVLQLVMSKVEFAACVHVF